jgi:hypothetical protein
MKKSIRAIVLGSALALALPAVAAELEVKAADSVESVLAAQKGKRVTLKTRSGQEITGTVKFISGRLVQLNQVAGKEFFDAVVPLDAVEAVLVRTKD